MTTPAESEARALIEETRIWAYALKPEERLKGEWYSLRLAGMLEDALASRVSTPSEVLSDAERRWPVLAMGYDDEGTRFQYESHENRKLREAYIAGASAVSAPPTITDETRDSAVKIALTRSDDWNHENLCNCREWPASCVTYGTNRPWSHDAETVARDAVDALVAALMSSTDR